MSDPTEWIVYGIVAGAFLILVYQAIQRKRKGKSGSCCDKGCEPPPDAQNPAKKK